MARLCWVLLLIAVRTEPGARLHLGAHVLQLQAIAHAEARAAEAAAGAAAPRARRLACKMRWSGLRSVEAK